MSHRVAVPDSGNAVLYSHVDYGTGYIRLSSRPSCCCRECGASLNRHSCRWFGEDPSWVPSLSCLYPPSHSWIPSPKPPSFPCRYFPSHPWIPFPKPHSLPPDEQGPLWIPPTLYGGCDQTKGPPWGRPPLWKLCPAGRFIYFSFPPFFLESQTFLAILESGSSNLMSEVEGVAPYKKDPLTHRDS